MRIIRLKWKKRKEVEEEENGTGEADDIEK
jgi:hypothetical protein